MKITRYSRWERSGDPREITIAEAIASIEDRGQAKRGTVNAIIGAGRTASIQTGFFEYIFDEDPAYEHDQKMVVEDRGLF